MLRINDLIFDINDNFYVNKSKYYVVVFSFTHIELIELRERS